MYCLSLGFTLGKSDPRHVCDVYTDSGRDVSSNMAQGLVHKEPSQILEAGLPEMAQEGLLLFTALTSSSPAPL